MPPPPRTTAVTDAYFLPEDAPAQSRGDEDMMAEAQLKEDTNPYGKAQRRFTDFGPLQAVPLPGFGRVNGPLRIGQAGDKRQHNDEKDGFNLFERHNRCPLNVCNSLRPYNLMRLRCL